MQSKIQTEISPGSDAINVNYFSVKSSHISDFEEKHVKMRRMNIAYSLKL